MPPKKLDTSKPASSKNKSKSKSKISLEDAGLAEGEEEYEAEEEGGQENTNSKNVTGSKSKLGKSADKIVDGSQVSKKKGKPKADSSRVGKDSAIEEANASQAGSQNSKVNKSKLPEVSDSKIDASQQNMSGMKKPIYPSPEQTSSVNNLSKPLPIPEPKINNCLVVTLTSCEFSKEFNYFIALQLGKNGDKKRTEVSQEVRNPAFRTNSFILPLENRPLDHYQEIYFSSFIVLNVKEYSREHADQEHAGEARLLGECVLNLIPLKPQLYDPMGQGIKQTLKLTRKSDKGEVTVGRFTVNIKYIGKSPQPEESVVVSQIVPDKVEEKNPNMSEIVRPLPKNDGYQFHWRIRVDIRSAIDVPHNRDTPKGLPSTFVEIGISDKLNNRPPEETLQVTKTIPEERNPIWNTQLLLINYQEQNSSKNVFLYLAVKDKGIKDGKPLESMYIPVNKMMAFLPYNLEFSANSFEFKNRAKYYISIILEEIDPKSKLEQYSDIVVHKIFHDPLPEKITRMWVAMTLFSYQPTVITFTPVDLSVIKEFGGLMESMAKENSQKRVFISSMLKIPSAEVFCRLYTR